MMQISCVVSKNKTKKKANEFAKSYLAGIGATHRCTMLLTKNSAQLKSKVKKRVQNFTFKSETRYRSLQVVRCHICNAH